MTRPVFGPIRRGILAALVGLVLASPAAAQQVVTPETFIRAETDRMFRDFVMLSGGVNTFHHVRSPTPLDQQTVVRMNRDTLYSGAVIDASGGATITFPDIPHDRHVSLAIIDNDHYAPVVFLEPGTHQIPADTPHMFAAVRIQIFDPTDPAEVALVNRLQDQFVIAAANAAPLLPFDWDMASLDALRAQYEAEAAGFPNFDGMMGPRGQVNEETRHVAAAAGWGLLPENVATYFSAFPALGADRCFTATFDVPENDAFWSVTMYDATGFIAYEDSIVNSSNVTLDADGRFTAFFGSEALCGDVPNRLDTPEGWNFMMRVYMPAPSVLGGGYRLPEIVPVM